MRRAPGIALATGDAPITKALIAINLAIYLVTAVQGAGLNSPGGALLSRFILVGSNLHGSSSRRTATSRTTTSGIAS